MKKLLMCPPRYFDVQYVINPWMADHLFQTNLNTAQSQWHAFYTNLQKFATVCQMQPQAHLPDLVFTANAALVLENQAILTRFRRHERQREEPYYKKWFIDHNYQLLKLPANVYFEGEGDALFNHGKSILWMGYNIRSDLKAASYLKNFFNIKVIALELVNQSFYHLDTCFCPLLDDYILYYPDAFSKTTQEIIMHYVPEHKRIIVEQEDAKLFACNALIIEKKTPEDKNIIFMNGASTTLQKQLKKLNYEVIIQPVSEFMKAGGAIKCLVLTL